VNEKYIIQQKKTMVNDLTNFQAFPGLSMLSLLTAPSKLSPRYKK
jgi:hypothetical protein